MSKHSELSAADAFGGDPLNPNDAMLERIVAVASGGKHDDMVERWKDAFNKACPEPVTPDTQLLAKLAGGKLQKEEVETIMSGAEAPQLPVAYRLAAMKEKK